MEKSLKSKDKRKIWIAIIALITLIISIVLKSLLSSPGESITVAGGEGPIYVGDSGTIIIEDDESKEDTTMINFCKRIREEASYQLHNINKQYKTEGISNEMLIVAGHRVMLNKIINLDCQTICVNKYEIQDSLKNVANVYH